MVYCSNVVKVMIASPGDVVEERNVVREVIAEWNTVHSEKDGVVLIPVGWETAATPMMGERLQEIINEQMLRDCDVLVGVFGREFGEQAKGREKAEWVGALELLENEGLVEDKAGTGTVYEVTANGYRFVDVL